MASDRPFLDRAWMKPLFDPPSVDGEQVNIVTLAGGASVVGGHTDGSHDDNLTLLKSPRDVAVSLDGSRVYIADGNRSVVSTSSPPFLSSSFSLHPSSHPLSVEDISRASLLFF